LDNLNTHFIGSLLETFGRRETNKLTKRIQFIYTLKHASWLNMAEIEINIMDRQCTGARIATQKELRSNVTKWARSRNKKKCTIDWKFTIQDADKKLSKRYVS
jgi:DDE superfamily endonuclease